jgi:hypothetical protein
MPQRQWACWARYSKVEAVQWALVVAGFDPMPPIRRISSTPTARPETTKLIIKKPTVELAFA